MTRIFSIDTPPPTVSGHLHMGHVFSYCHADFIARYKKMTGCEVKYPIGFDDNGLPTERLVEKITGVRVGFKYSDDSKKILLEKFGKNYDGLCSKADFVEICQKVVDEAEVEFEKLFKSIDLSVDWSLKYQSISNNSAKIAQEAFINLHEKGLIYNANAPVYWCCADKTATANAEIEEKEVDSFQVEVKWKTQCGIDFSVMTTRPEMLPACVAVLINPDDEKNRHLIGKNAVVPLGKELRTSFNVIGINKEGDKEIIGFDEPFIVPIIGDRDAKPDKGTGIVMCCTYGDWQDVIWTKRHNLGEKIIISEDGKITQIINSADFENWKGIISNIKSTEHTNANTGMMPVKIEEARNNTILKLEQARLVVEKKAIRHMVKCAERSGKPLEILPTPQWYVRVLPFKKVLLEMASLVHFHPKSMKIKLENWINGLSQDWCISRNRFFGIDIPMYWENGKYIPFDKKDLPFMYNTVVKKVAEDCEYFKNSVELQDKEKGVTTQWAESSNATVDRLAGEYAIDMPKQVLDTWFTSGLSPKLCGLKQDGVPLSLRPQAHEIIRTWTFVTLVQSYLNDAIEIIDNTENIVPDYDLSDSNTRIEIEKEYVIVKSGDKFLKCYKPKTSHLPWENVMLSGWCLASDKTKMSKSKGNIVTPIDLIEKYGSDAVRYWSGSSTLGMDTAYNEEHLKAGHKLITKLRNAVKLCMQTVKSANLTDVNYTFKPTNFIDRGILSFLSQKVGEYRSNMDSFEYSKALQSVEDFFWYFCDNYLELAKVRSYGIEALIYKDKKLSNEEIDKIKKSQNSTAQTMFICIDIITKFFSPFLPKITSEIIKEYNFNTGLQEFIFNDENAIMLLGIVNSIIDQIRKAKSEAGVSLKTAVKNISITSNYKSILELDGIEDIYNCGNITSPIKISEEISIELEKND